MRLSGLPNVKLADILLRHGANLRAKVSNRDSATLFEQASNFDKRVKSLPFDAMITAFMADRLKAIR